MTTQKIKNACLRQAQAIYKNALDCIFPPLCYSCFSHLKNEEKKLRVCEKCAVSVKIHSSLFCPICKSRIPLPNYLPAQAGSERSPCHRQAGFLLAACADFDNPAVRELIHTLKYRNIENAIHPITELLVKPYLKYIGPISPIRPIRPISPTHPIVIVPMPLHKKKLKKRGFNQSALIARALRQCLEIREWRSDIPNIEPPRESPAEGGEDIRPPKIINALVRVKKTESQAEAKSKNERLENVKNCFTVVPELVEGLHLKTIVLVDDVTTSGATMQEAVKTLKQAGAKKILAFVIAKA